MAFKSLRDYIDALEKNGELTTVDQEVDWNLEVGAITRLVNERSLPAPFFQKIKGYPSGFRILGCPLNSHRKLAVALGMDSKASYQEVINVIRERKGKSIKPVIVDRSQAPCKENVCLGEEIDLRKFPSPVLHDGDGGRYLCTWHINVSKDPDTGWVNWGMYRSMNRSKDTMTGMLRPNVHMGYHFFRKYKPKGLPMPFAIAIGTEPICSFMGAAKTDPNISEADIAGALRGEPVELVKCETVDLEVPAHSEIVIEGEISPTETDWEGPFGEFVGYTVTPRSKKVIYNVKAITHRNDPILTVSCMGTPIDEAVITRAMWRSPEVFNMLTAEGIPVTGVHFPSECVGFLVIVGVRSRLAGVPNIAQRIAARIWGSEIGLSLPYIMVVDEDIDVYNMTEVMHAFVTKCHPYRGITRLEHATGVPHMPFLTIYEREHRLGAKTVFDCTWPLEWDPVTDVPPKTSFRAAYPRELQDYVLKNWRKYGFDELT